VWLSGCGRKNTNTAFLYTGKYQKYHFHWRSDPWFGALIGFSGGTNQITGMPGLAFFLKYIEVFYKYHLQIAVNKIKKCQ